MSYDRQMFEGFLPEPTDDDFDEDGYVTDEYVKRSGITRYKLIGEDGEVIAEGDYGDAGSVN